MKKMKLIGMMISLMAAFLLVVGPMAGCGSKKTGDTMTTTTTGQELQDLDDAYQKGIITEKEYNAQKKKILSR